MRALFLLILSFLGPGFVLSAQEYRIAYQCIDWIPGTDEVIFTAMKVKTDWSDYSPDKWRLYSYHLGDRELTDLGNSILCFSISRDGQYIAFDKNKSYGKDIYNLNRNTGQINVLINAPAKDTGPSWSPDGSEIVFYSDREGHEELYTYDRKMGQIVRITHREADKSYNPQWAPDSDLIVYYLEKGDNKDQIYLTDSSGSFQKNLTDDEHHNIFPSWTPDGRILYVRDRGEVVLMNQDGSGKTILKEGLVAGLVRMDPSGSRVLMTDGDGNLGILNLGDLTSEIILDRNSF